MAGLSAVRVNPGSRRHLVETIRLVEGATIPSQNLAERISRLGQISRLDLVLEVTAHNTSQTNSAIPEFAEPAGGLLEDVRVKINRETVYQVEGRFAEINAALTTRWAPPMMSILSIPPGGQVTMRALIPIPFNLNRTLKMSDGGYLGGERS